VHFHLGSGTTVARVSLLQETVLQPGSDTLARLRLEQPVVAVHGDRFVVRRYSPTRTIGGGTVLNPAPSGRRGRSAVRTVEAADRGGAEGLVVAAIASRGAAGLDAAEVAAVAGVDAAVAVGAISTLAGGRLLQIGERLYARTSLMELEQRIEDAIQEHHQRAPWRAGMPRDDLKSRLAAAVHPGGFGQAFEAALTDLLSQGKIVESRGLVARAGFNPASSQTDQRAKAVLLQTLERAAASPPPLDELRRLVDAQSADRMLQALLDEGLVVAVNPELRFAAAAVDRIRETVMEMIRAGQEVTVATLRDRLHTSRRYALALLEYFDGTRLTRRVGDRRVLGSGATPQS
jgi:selenocysteine-specific elongation factor